MLDVKRVRLGTGGWVVSARGELDGAAAAEVASVVAKCDDTVVVDLLSARFVDLDVVDAFVEALGPNVTFVAEHTLLHALLVVGLRRPVAVESTLVGALA